MLKRIRIKNFKSLRETDLALGRLNFFIGTNASGKSNLLEALKVLRLLMSGLPIKDLFERGDQTATGAFPGIRGGLANAIYRGSSSDTDTLVREARLEVELEAGQGLLDYQISFNKEGATTWEKMTDDTREVFSFDGKDATFTNPDPKNPSTIFYPDPSNGSQIIFGLLSGFTKEHSELIRGLGKSLLSMQFLELVPDVLRSYGTAVDIKRMGNHGENFASVIRSICSDAKVKDDYLGWLQEMRPQEVEDVVALTGAVGEPMFALKEAGKEFPAPVLSDGTLRFAALAAAFFQPSMPEVLAIEEVENGIHGSRLRLLLELLRTQSAATNTQVLATTHSPLLLSWLKPEEYETTFLCTRDQETGESIIVPLTEVPHFKEIVSSNSISELFTEGWLEAAI